MPAPPRAPTFPAFVDDPQAVDAAVDPAKMPDSTVPVVPFPLAPSKSRIRPILLWRDPKLSAAVLASFLVFFYLTLIRDNAVLSVLGLFAALYFTARFLAAKVNARLSGKFDQYLKRPPANTPLFRKATVYRLADLLLEEGNEVGEEIRDLLYCESPSLTAAALVVSFAIYHIGRYFSLLSVLLVIVIVLFTVPVAYQKNKKQVDDGLAKASETASQHVETARQAVSRGAVQAGDFARQKSAPLLEKAPPAARDFAERIGLTPKKAKPQ